MSPDATDIVIDTNVLLHFKRLDDVGWLGFFEGPIRFVVPPTTLAELDRHKTSTQAKIQRRARKLLPWLEQMNGKSLRDGVTLTVAALEPIAALKRHPDLDPLCPDDRIVAFALQLVSGDSIPPLFISRDTTPRMKARAKGLTAQSPPDALLLVEDASSEEQESARMRAELDQLKNRMPQLSTRFTGQKSSYAIGPDTRANQKSRINKRMESESTSLAGAVRGKRKDYLRDQHLADYRPYLEELEDFYDVFSRLIMVHLSLSNTGSAVATSVKLTLKWSSGTKYLSNFPALPDKPYATTNTDVHGRGWDDTHTVMSRQEVTGINIGGPSGPHGQQAGRTCQFHINEVLHGDVVRLTPIPLILPSADRSGFSVDWTIQCKERPIAQTGTLHAQTLLGRSFEDLLDDLYL